MEDDYVEDDYVEDVIWGPMGPHRASRLLYVGRPLRSRPQRSTIVLYYRTVLYIEYYSTIVLQY